MKFLIFLTVLLTFQSAHADACDTNTCGAPRRILIVGDSEAGYVSRRISEVKLAHDTVEVDAKSSTTIQYWSELGNFLTVLNRHQKSDIVVIFLGTNNYGNTTLPNVAPILDEVVKRNLKCIWVGPTAVRGKNWPINAMLKARVQPVCKYLDTQASNISLEDGIHPTHESILKWLKLVWSLL
jgi:hypothetical protein